MLPLGKGASPYGSSVVKWVPGTVHTPLYARDDLGAGDRFDGPAIITQLDTTTLIPPAWSAETHETGTLILRPTRTVAP